MDQPRQHGKIAVRPRDQPAPSPPKFVALRDTGATVLAAQDVSNKADFVGLSPRLLSIDLSP
jgi:hypothetical protein